MFSLESIKAKHGDCLVLKWGTKPDPGIALIDGGPRGVYKKFVKPRFAELAEERGVEQLEFDLTMVSHIDEDHIGGLLDFATDIENNDASAKIKRLWFNSLEGLLDHKFGGGATAALASVGGVYTKMAKNEAERDVLASVPQGQQLDVFVKRAGIGDLLNLPFPKIKGSDQRLVIAAKTAATFKGLELRVIGPTAEEIEKLRTEWVKKRDAGITADFSDPSPYNLSSIVVMATFGKKRMLLTGDGRGDLIIAGLKEAKLMKKDKLHVDLLKLPHHGSRNNVTPEFFEQITADHYVVSGDGVKFPNPHKDAMKWLADARGDDDYTVYCPYELKHMRKRFGDRLVVPEGEGTSVTAVLS